MPSEQMSRVRLSELPKHRLQGEFEGLFFLGPKERLLKTYNASMVLDGDPIDIAFNPSYLLDGLTAAAAASTRFSFTQATRPAVLTGVGEDGTTPDYRYLLMPVRLTG